MRNRSWVVVIAAAVVVIFVVGVASATLKQGDKFPDFKLQALDGKTKTLKDKQFREKVLVIDVWATWCPPCRKEIPELVKLYTEYKSKGVEVIGVATDRDGEEKVKPFAKDYKINYTTLLDTKSELAGNKLKVRAIPTLFIVDKKGVIRYVHVGYTDKATLEKEIKELL
jgi:peroxiredoxin